VDDEQIVGATMCRLLESEGYVATLAAEPARALEILEKSEKPFCLALLDLNLKHMTGEALAVQIHRIDPSLPLIAVTGMALPILARHGGNGGFAGALEKPFPRDQLLQIVEQHLRLDVPEG